MPSRNLLAALLPPLRSYVARITERADAGAVAAGLTVDVLRSGVRRYRHPRLDGLAPHRASHPVVRPSPADTAWSRPRFVGTSG
jgi:hypothetical protein